MNYALAVMRLHSNSPVGEPLRRAHPLWFGLVDHKVIVSVDSDVSVFHYDTMLVPLAVLGCCDVVFDNDVQAAWTNRITVLLIDL